MFVGYLSDQIKIASDGMNLRGSPDEPGGSNNAVWLNSSRIYSK